MGLIAGQSPNPPSQRVGSGHSRAYMPRPSATGVQRGGGLKVALSLFFISFVCYSYCIQVYGWNQSSRMAEIMAIVDRHTLAIDAYQDSTEDKAYYHGHYYSEKAPGTALLGVPIYAGLRVLEQIAPEDRLARELHFNLYIISIAVVAFPSALLVVLMYYLCLRAVGQPAWSFLISMVYGFGTLALPFSTVFFEHQDVAFLMFAAFIALIRYRESLDPRLLLVAGATMGAGVVMEYQAVLIAGVLSIYALFMLRSPRRFLLIVTAGLPFVGVVFGYNWLMLGSPVRFAYHYITFTYFSEMHAGFFGITYPRLAALRDILLSPRGLLVESPFLLLLPFAAVAMFRDRRWRAELVTCLAVAAVYLMYNASYYQPIGGDSPGPRFLVPMLPFATFPLVFLARYPKPRRRLLGITMIILGSYSTCLYLLITVTNPLADGGYGSPLSAYWWPRFQSQHLLPNAATLAFHLYGYESLLPLLLMLAAGLVAYVRAARASVGASPVEG